MSSKPMSNLQQRVISAVVLAVVVLALTWLGGLPFKLLCAAIGIAMLYEWLAMSASQTTPLIRQAAWIVLCVTLAALILGLSAWIVFAVLW